MFTEQNIQEYYVRNVLEEKTDVEKTTEEILKDAAELAEVLVPRSMSHLRLWRATILRVLNVKKQMSIFTCS